MERVAEMAAAGSRGFGGDGPEVNERLERWWAEASGEEERREAEAAAEAAALGEAAVYGAADWAAVQEALRRMMPEEGGMVFRPAEPPEWNESIVTGKKRKSKNFFGAGMENPGSNFRQNAHLHAFGVVLIA